MERIIKFVLAYDGTDFHGWQRQAGVRTAQQELEDVLRRVLRHPLSAPGASRTDTGVHARGQVASVATESPVPLENLHRAIGHRLPADMAIVNVALAAPGFRPTRDASRKLYRYRIFNHVQRPVASFAQRYTWHVWYPLDLERLQAAAAELVGTHDFAGFASQGSPRETTVRTVYRVGVARVGDEVQIDVEGNGFLYHQVRNMVGTLVEIGRGHWLPERIGEILAARDRRLAGPTAPPQGLCLEWVRCRSEEEPTVGAD
jgi:tRNA pseudouridine38-40 synthase